MKRGSRTLGRIIVGRSFSRGRAGSSTVAPGPRTSCAPTRDPLTHPYSPDADWTQGPVVRAVSGRSGHRLAAGCSSSALVAEGRAGPGERIPLTTPLASPYV